MPNPLICCFAIMLFLMVSVQPCHAGRPALNIGLIGAKDLHDHLSSWVVLDGRPHDLWRAAHIPGAFSFSWEQYTRTDGKGIPYRILPPRQLAAVLGSMGIDENTPVAVYGDADTSWGGEGWCCWVLAWLGHKGPIRLLNGGLQAWGDQRYSVESGIPKRKIKAVAYHYHCRQSLIITTEAIRKHPAAYQLVDTRSFLEWIRGRVPGAVRIEWTHFYNGPQRRPLSPEKLRTLLSDNGIDPKKPVVYYCAGGIRSAYAWLVQELSGLPAAINYEGGFEAWKHSKSSH